MGDSKSRNLDFLFPRFLAISLSTVWWINFDPSVGSEIEKERPAVILSNNAANRNLNRFQFNLSSQSQG